MTTKKRKAEETHAEPDSVLTTTAVAIGSAIGSLVAKTGLAGSPERTLSAPKAGKLPKKTKQRLPRKAKKQLAKSKKPA